MARTRLSSSRIAPLLLAVLTCLVAACGATETEPDACNNLPEILFFDDFNGELNCGWAPYNRGGGIAAVEGVGEGAGDFAGIGNSIFCSASVCSIGSGRLKQTAYMFFSNKVSESVIMPSEIELNKNALIFHIVT